MKCEQCLRKIHGFDYYIVYFERKYCSIDCMTLWSERNESLQESAAIEETYSYDGNPNEPTQNEEAYLVGLDNALSDSDLIGW